MKIISDYEPDYKLNDKLQNGDIVFMKGSQGTGDFYGIYSYGIGVLELECGSSAYASTKEQLYIGSKVSYWTVQKVFRNCELIIKE